MSDQTTAEIVSEMERGINALILELPAPVWRDVLSLWRLVVERLTALETALDVAVPPPYKYTDSTGTWQRTGHGGSANSRTFQYHRVHGT